MTFCAFVLYWHRSALPTVRRHYLPCHYEVARLALMFTSYTHIQCCAGLAVHEVHEAATDDLAAAAQLPPPRRRQRVTANKPAVQAYALHVALRVVVGEI